MMPPKKSKAARAEVEPVIEKPEEVKDDKEPVEEPMEEEEEDDEEDPPKVNIFITEVVEGKRQRAPLMGQQKFEEWIKANLEESDEGYLPHKTVHELYVESCVKEGITAFDFRDFVKAVKQTFPNRIHFRSDSLYHSVVKEKKPKKSSGDKPKRNKIQANSNKMRDLIKEVFEEADNPRQGMRPVAIKKRLMAKCPALQLDLYPSLLRKALARGVYHGFFTLVKGIGNAGSYRMFVEGEVFEEVEKKKSKKKIQLNGEAPDEGEEKTEGEGAEEEGKEEVKKEDGDAEKKEEGEEKAEEKPKKKRKARAKKPRKDFLSRVVHSDPKRIIDTFQMAVTFMADPKEAPVSRIKRYISDYYHRDIDLDKLKKALQDGSDRKLWGQVSGTTPLTGVYQLLMDEFDPLEDKNLTGMITNALMACHEPKQCSIRLIKQYIAKYHPEFKVSDRPIRFKSAIEKAIDLGIFRRLTGIGTSGTVQLIKPFNPSPLILAGNDTTSDYESLSDEDNDEGKGKAINGRTIDFSVEQFQDAYKPRPSKRHARQASLGIPAEPVVVGRFRQTTVKAKVPKKKPRKTVRKGGKKAPKYVDDSESEEEEEEVVPVAKSRKTVPKSPKKPVKKAAKSPAKSTAKSPGKRGRKKASPRKMKEAITLHDEDDDSEDDEEEEEIVPRKRGAPKAAKSANKKKKAPSTKNNSRSSARKSNVSYAEVSSDEDIFVDMPVKKKGRK